MTPPAPQREDASLIGRTIGRYRVTGLLGRGGMGAVYAAEDASLGRPVALKVLEGDFVATGERRARFFREARGAAAATHENIAAVYEVGEADGRVFLAMELVEGRTLRDTLAQHPGGLPIAEVLRVGRAIARGLAKAHEAGVIHRDLKPENVLLGDEDRVKILDFGIAKLRSEREAGEADRFATQEGRILGTPHYMSPEQAAGRAIDERSDLFSLGILLFEMATGRQPFDGETPMLILVAIARDEPPLPSTLRPDIPVELEGLIARCLSKAPELRPPSARSVGEELRRCADGSPLEPVSSGGATGPRRDDAHALGSAPTLLEVKPAPDAVAGLPTLASVPGARRRGPRWIALGVALALVPVGILVVIKASAPGLPANGAPPPATSTTTAAAATPGAATSAARALPALRFRRLSSSSADVDVSLPCLAPDGLSFAYVVGGRLYRQPFANGVRQPVQLSGVASASGVACLPGGDLLVSGQDAKGNPGVWRAGDPAVAPSRLLDQEIAALRPSHGGSLLLRWRTEGLFVESLDGRERRIVRPISQDHPAELLAADWSPDDSAIAMIWIDRSGTRADSHMEIVSADGSGAKTLLSDERLILVGGAASVTWLDTGRLAIALAHTMEEEPGTGLYVQAIDAGHRLVGEPVRVHDFPGVSITTSGYDRSARRLLLVTTSFQQDVLTAPLLDDGRRLGKTARLTLDDRNDRPTSWLPDGRVLFMSDRSGNWDAFAQRPNSEPDALLGGPAWDTWPIAADNGAILAFQLDPEGREGKCPVVRREPSGAVRPLFEARCERSFLAVGRPPPLAAAIACLHRTPERCLLREPSTEHLILTPFDARTGERVGAPLDTGAPASQSTEWAISPDDRELAVTGTGARITLVPLSGHGSPTVLDSGLQNAQYPAWTPSGAAVILAGMGFENRNYAMVRVDRSGRVTPLLSSDNAWISQPRTSPNGETLAFGMGSYDADVGCLEGL